MTASFDLNILSEAPASKIISRELVLEKQQVLLDTLKEFKVSATAGDVSVGPTVIRIEFELAPGILVSKVTKLQNNIQIALMAKSVHFVTSIPGRQTIAVEIPNDNPQIVSLRECISTEEYVGASSKLTFAIGKDITGKYQYADLAKMPHLLVGGSTNSGKSAFLNSLISSILYRATPQEVKFVLIDPKRVELSMYKDIPHLLMPVITDVSRASEALQSLIKEMERRFDLFAKEGNRNITNYNEKAVEKLPYIVVVIDELAELMMTNGKDVEKSICRLAQLARATGIHLVVATQRPSVDVITGLIKSNIGSRIAFSVATSGDSRTITGLAGAENLIGRGDMLFMPIGDNSPLRVQGCFISEDETHNIVDDIKKPVVSTEVKIKKQKENSLVDQLLADCIRYVVAEGQFSQQGIQMHFGLTFEIARKLMETLKVFAIVRNVNGVYVSKVSNNDVEDFIHRYQI